jgi:hypothetical protein
MRRGLGPSGDLSLNPCLHFKRYLRLRRSRLPIIGSWFLEIDLSLHWRHLVLNLTCKVGDTMDGVEHLESGGICLGYTSDICDSRA